MDYDDLMELARLCSLRANAASTSAVATVLRHMAEGYRARAAAMRDGQCPDIATEPVGASNADAPSGVAQQQQQQQPQNPSTGAGADPKPSPSAPKRR